MFKRNQPNDVLFLMPVRLADEKKPRGGVRMLYCDAGGKLYTSIVRKSVYQRARAAAEAMEHHRKPFAILGLETAPGNFLPAAVEISPPDVWALEHILEHALKNGNLPDLLRKYLKPIIRRAESGRESVISEQRKRRTRAKSQATPQVLERLPYYPERDMEISMPIYKAEYSYPLIFLKRLPPDKNTSRTVQRLLILDSAGDLGVIAAPLKLVRQMELELNQRDEKSQRNTSALISNYQEDIIIHYMSISQQQKKALNTLTRYFEETGNGKYPISAVARAVLVRARYKVSPPVR